MMSCCPFILCVCTSLFGLARLMVLPMGCGQVRGSGIGWMCRGLGVGLSGKDEEFNISISSILYDFLNAKIKTIFF